MTKNIGERDFDGSYVFKVEELWDIAKEYAIKNNLIAGKNTVPL